MTKMPRQLIIFVLVLSSYFWPWQLFSGDSKESWLASVIVMQWAFIRACLHIISERWILLIAIVEIIAMQLNVILFSFPSILRDFHAEIILSAVIIELLIITISLQGVAIESNRYRSPLAGSGFGFFSNRRRYDFCNKEVFK